MKIAIGQLDLCGSRELQLEAMIVVGRTASFRRPTPKVRTRNIPLRCISQAAEYWGAPAYAQYSCSIGVF